MIGVGVRNLGWEVDDTRNDIYHLHHCCWWKAWQWSSWHVCILTCICLQQERPVWFVAAECAENCFRLFVADVRRDVLPRLAVVLVAAWWQMGAGSWWRQRRQGHLHTSILVITVIQFAHSDIPMNIDYQICMQYLEKVLTCTFSVLKVPVLSLACSVNLQVTQFYRWRLHV